MLRALVSVAAGLAMAGFATAASAQEEKVVNVYNWSDYIDETILEDFTKETGIKVVYDVYDSNEILETKLLSGGTGYDVVVPSAAPFMVRQIQAGALQKLDKSKLPNLTHVWDQIAERVSKYDPGNEYSVNYMWGTTGIGYNVDKIAERMEDAPTDSWDMIFDPDVVSKFADCGVYMLDAPAEMIPAALNYLGLDPNSKDPDDIAKAGEALKAIRPYIQKFHSSAYIDSLANGDICLAVGWSGDVFQAIDAAADGVNVKYVIPKQGAQMWFDQMAIPVDAPHPDNAHTFINYMLQPEVVAKASNYVFYANGNKDAVEFIDAEVKDDPAIYPPDDVMEKLFTVDSYDPKTQRIITRTWTSVKTGQ